MNNNYLFVYGTLLKKIDNEFSRYLKENSINHGRAYFHGLLFNIGEYPGAVYIPSVSYKVHGNLLALKSFSEVIQKLDEYEEVGCRFESPNEYVREIITVKSKTEKVDCWTYLYNHGITGKEWIKSGNYLDCIT